MFRSGNWRVPVAIGAASAALVAGVTVGLTGVASASKVHHNSRVHEVSGGVIKFAESAGASPNYIFPETSTANQSLYNNSQFINLMWPLIYTPTPDQPTLDYAHSMANPPVWSDNDTVVTVTLKNYKWSDGTPVTARDVIFYINLGKAMGSTWGNYDGPTQFPYNLKSYTAVNATTVKFVLKSPTNPTFFDDNGIDLRHPDASAGLGQGVRDGASRQLRHDLGWRGQGRRLPAEGSRQTRPRTRPTRCGRSSTGRGSCKASAGPVPPTCSCRTRATRGRNRLCPSSKKSPSRLTRPSSRR